MPELHLIGLDLTPLEHNDALILVSKVSQDNHFAHLKVLKLYFLIAIILLDCTLTLNPSSCATGR